MRRIMRGWPVGLGSLGRIRGRLLSFTDPLGTGSCRSGQ